MNDSIIEILEDGGIGVLLTDTLYGLVGRALDRRAVKRIYKIKGRDDKKPLIILISAIENLEIFGIKIDAWTRDILNEYWPGPVSIIIPCNSKKFEYLHRGTGTLAFRLPRKQSIVKILQRTGPLVAPSANPEGMQPAKNIREAKNYFYEKADFYFGAGRPRARPSTIIKIGKTGVAIVRK